MNTIREFYNLLFARYGNLDWWPGETPFEIMIGAILTQNTNWKNVEKALSNLDGHGLLDPHKLLFAEPDVVREAIRPSGYYNQKAKKLATFMEWLDS
ncbi:MAG: endonuclease, partial [bacterium]